MMTSPPRPPSPPSGPPIGTNFSRRKELMPEPPSPALTRTTTRSMNMTSLSFDPGPEQPRRCGAIGPDHRLQRLHGRRHDARCDADIQRAVEMRMQLPILLRSHAHGSDAQLTPSKVQPPTRKPLAVSLHDHPFVQLGVKVPNVLSQ